MFPEAIVQIAREKPARMPLIGFFTCGDIMQDCTLGRCTSPHSFHILHYASSLECEMNVEKHIFCTLITDLDVFRHQASSMSRHGQQSNASHALKMNIATGAIIQSQQMQITGFF